MPHSPHRGMEASLNTESKVEHTEHRVARKEGGSTGKDQQGGTGPKGKARLVVLIHLFGCGIFFTKRVT